MSSYSISKGCKIDFITNDFTLALIGYPVWEASIAATESAFWVKVIPDININERIIYLPTPRKIPNGLDKNVLISSDLKEDYQSSFDQMISLFFDSIPKDIKITVSKYKDSHWDFIKAINLLGEDLLKLIQSNPVLAYVVVNIDKINRSFLCYTNIEILQRMIKTKHKEILKLAGFPEAERMVKLFLKMEPSSISVKDLTDLRNVLMIRAEITEDILKLLSFAKKIDFRLIRLVAEYNTLLNRMTHKLIFEITNSTRFSEIYRALYVILYCSKRLNTQVPNITSIKSIERLSLKLKEELRAKEKLDIMFPKQPLEDNCYIQALCSEGELNNWANVQHNCISRYIDEIRKGKKYFYKVIYNNEEATLELKLKEGKVRRGDLRGKFNIGVSIQLKKVVDKWLKLNRECYRKQIIN